MAGTKLFAVIDERHSIVFLRLRSPYCGAATIRVRGVCALAMPALAVNAPANKTKAIRHEPISIRMVFSVDFALAASQYGDRSRRKTILCLSTMTAKSFVPAILSRIAHGKGHAPGGARASGLRSGDEAAPATFDDMSRLNPFKETRQ